MTERRADPTPASASHPAASRHLVAHLERFWPSRRLDAFDEFCRGC
ncbi:MULTISPECIES: hypothetical protein [unclassified Pseudonocardia]|nr:MULTISPECIES: hypothetical protein [unclassified Pseudonocardia]